MQLIEVKRNIVHASDQVILLSDFTKFDSKSLSPSVELSEINTIITDNKIDSQTLANLKKLKVNVICI